MPYQLRPEDLAGFDIYGSRNNDGTITIGHAEPTVRLPAFPDKVEVLGNVYTLEAVTENDGMWRENAEPNDPRLRICWGVYV